MGALGRVALGVVGGVAAAPWAPGDLLAWGLWVVGWALLGLAARWRAPTALLAGVGLGVLAVAGQPAGPVLRGPVALRGVVAGAVSGSSADLALHARAEAGGGWQRARGRVRARWPDPPPASGTEVILRGEATAVGGGAWPGEPDPVVAARRGRVRTALRVRSSARIGGHAPARDRFGGVRHGGVLRALVTGDRGAIEPAAIARLRRTGTAHLLAISGFHVGLVALVVGVLVRAGLRGVAVLRPAGVGEGAAWWVGAAAGVLYAGWVGAPPSAWRAAGLVVAVAGARTLGRDVLPLRLVAVVAAVQTILDPPVLGTPGFLLSYGAVVGILRFTPQVLRWVPPDLPRPVDRGLRGAATTVGAVLGTLPAAAWWFQAVAPWSVPANLVAMPVVALGIAPCAALALAPDPVGAWALLLGDRLVAALLAVLAPLDVEPWHPAVGPLGAALLGVVLLVARRPVLVAVLLALALTVRPAPEATTITALPRAGHRGVLVEWADGRRWWIDGGPPGDWPVRWLRRRGVRQLDVVIATRGTDPRSGAAADVVRALGAGQVWLPAEGAGTLADAAREVGAQVVRLPASGDDPRDLGVRVGPPVPSVDRPTRWVLRPDRSEAWAWRAGRGWQRAPSDVQALTLERGREPPPGTR